MGVIWETGEGREEEALVKGLDDASRSAREEYTKREGTINNGLTEDVHRPVRSSRD